MADPYESKSARVKARFELVPWPKHQYAVLHALHAVPVLLLIAAAGGMIVLGFMMCAAHCTA
jgi:hypothetical protein